MSFARNIRFAFRTFHRSYRLAATIIFTLALGIASATTMFSVVDSVLLHPYPYRNLERLATFHIRFLDSGSTTRYFFSGAELLNFKQLTKSAEDIAGVANLDVYYSDGRQITKLNGAWVTANAFSMLGVQPLRGRPISQADGGPAAPAVFAVSEAAWTRQFQRDPTVVGRTMTLNGSPRTLVGIMPSQFRLGQCDVWLPTTLRESASQAADQGPFFWPLVLLKRGASIATAEADLNVIANRLPKVFPAGYLDRFSIAAESLTDSGVGSFKNLLIFLSVAVAMLLLISCINVAILQLAQGTQRQTEFAVRASLGASRKQIIRQILVESSTLAGCAAVVGYVLSYWATRLIAGMVPGGSIPLESTITMNWRALLFCILVAAAATVISGLSPALILADGDAISHLASRSRLGASRHQSGLRSVFIVANIALSLVLLIGSGLMIRSFVALRHVRLGFDPAKIIFASIHHPGGFSSAPQEYAFYRNELEKVSGLPGVAAATLAVTPPPFGSGLTSVKLPRESHPRQADALSDLVSEEYFRTIGAQLLSGRTFTRNEVDSARPVVVVNQAFTAAFFDIRDAVGQYVEFPSWDQLNSDWPHGVSFQVIGVVSNFRNNGLRLETMPEAFLPYTMTATGLLDNRAILLRASGNAVPTPLLLDKAVREVDSTALATDVGSLESILQHDELAQPRFSTVVLALFSSLGLFLAAIGLFSVMAYNISLRTYEIGVRIAVGAQPSDIRRLILGNGMRLTAAGIALGIVLSLVLARFVQSELWGISSNDLVSFAAGVLVLFAASLCANIIPALRATRVDPLLALRHE